MKTFVIGDVHGRRAQLENLLELLPRDNTSDTLVLLGDLIDRGADAPGVVADVAKLKQENPERVITLRGNHEQMILDFIDGTGPLWWLMPATGGGSTFEQYTGDRIQIHSTEDLENARLKLKQAVPPEQLEFLRGTQLFHEDDHALYVHAGLAEGKHPRETSPEVLLWARDMNFYKNYRGKPCVFGHTPTSFLPLRGRLGRHGLYIFHSAIGIDTGYNAHSPLSCLSLPDFMLYQTFADGRTEVHQISMFMPEELRQMQAGESESRESESLESESRAEPSDLVG